jgi:NAD(P)-dependent dehydrogenase (short-subunit alcohol dehydrogenase family)
MNRLKDKIAIVTGAASGIGEAGAIRMAAEGAKVIAADISIEGANRTVETIRKAGGEATAILMDAMKDESIAEMVRKAHETYGAIHVLYNNVGGTDSTRDRSLVDMDWEMWGKAIQLNLNSTAYAIRCALPIMIAGGGGSIVNTTSNSALQAGLGPTAYPAAKGGVIALTKLVAAHYGKQRIRCNVISPGMVLSYRETPRSDALLSIIEKHNMLPYLGQPEDIANTAVFLASDEARYITGQTIAVDGGSKDRSGTMADLIDLVSSGKPLFPPPGAKM